MPIYKFTDGATDGDLVSSVYFDNDARQLYEGRLKKFDGAIAFRIRWYGQEEARQQVYVERKTHREDWWGDGDSSAKERFPLAEDQVVPFLDGSLTPEQVGEALRAARFRGNVTEAVELAREVQASVRTLGLRPQMRTHYMRTAFQRTGDAQVRCSLDTELCLALEPCEAHQWRRHGPLQHFRQVTQFPHAVLELKLQLSTGTMAPEWVTALLTSGYLREVPKFSKFVHGTAALNQHGGRQVTELPYWWDPALKPLWAGAAAEAKPLPAHMLADAHMPAQSPLHRRSRRITFGGGTTDRPPPAHFFDLDDGMRKLHALWLAIVTCRAPDSDTPHRDETRL